LKRCISGRAAGSVFKRRTISTHLRDSSSLIAGKLFRCDSNSFKPLRACSADCRGRSEFERMPAMVLAPSNWAVSPMDLVYEYWPSHAQNDSARRHVTNTFDIASSVLPVASANCDET